MNVYLIGVLRATDREILASERCNKVFEVSMLKETIATYTSMIPTKRYALDGAENLDDDTIPSFTIHFFLSKSKSVVYMCVVNKSYPLRLANSLLIDIETYFEENGLMEQVHKSKEKGLNKKCRKFLQETAIKYEDPSSVDALYRMNEKLDVLKGQAASSIGTLLDNRGSLHDIEKGTERLTQQSMKLRKKAKTIEKNSAWTAMKNKVGITILIILALLIMFTPLFFYLAEMHQYEQDKK